MAAGEQPVSSAGKERDVLGTGMGAVLPQHNVGVSAL